MTTPLKPTRSELATFAGGNQRVLRAVEEIFDKTVPQTDEAFDLATQANDRLDALVLDDLQDVTTAGVGGGYLLHYVNGTQQWTPTNYLQGIRFGAASDYTTFESDGFMVAYGEARAWQDIDFPIIIRTIGPNIPTLTVMQGNITAPQWAVNDYNVCEGQELIHLWFEGSTLYWHIHMVTNGLDVTDRYTLWEIEWCWANPNGVLSAAATITSPELLIPANTPDKTHLTLSLGTSALPTGKIAAHVWARLRRIASVGAAPTGNPWVSMLQVHVEVDTLGSRNIGTK